MPIGEMAALATAASFAVSSILFESAGKRIGSLSVNFIRVVIALVVMILVNWWLRGLPWPTDASGHAWIWLGLSGVVGLTLGDICLFRAFVLLGARLAILIMMLVPPMTAIMGWLILGETLTWLDVAGMAATLGGVALVVTERSPVTSGELASNLKVGVWLALGGALGQASGLVLGKYGMGQYSALAATEIRMIFGVLGFVAVFFVIRWWPKVWAARQSMAGLVYTSLGAFAGPVLGITLALYAIQNTNTGVASSIMATSPLLIIPLSAVISKERITGRSVAGTVIALLGVALLFR